MGGMIAQAMAIKHPDKVASLTSIMSNTGDRKHGRMKRSMLRKLPKLMVRNPDDAVANGVEMFRLISGPHFDPVAARQLGEEGFARSYQPDGAARQTMAIAASPDRTWDLRRVRVPTLVVHGLLDPLVTPSGGIATAQAVPGAKLVMYPDMGHDLPLPRWDDLIDEIVENARKPVRPDRRARPGTGRRCPEWINVRRWWPSTSRASCCPRSGSPSPNARASRSYGGRHATNRTTTSLMRGRLELLDRHGLTLTPDHRHDRRSHASPWGASSSSTSCGNTPRSSCSPTRSPSSPGR